jgi:hypothetical protein
MSELTNAQTGQRDFRWRLLTTVSAAALLASVCMAYQARAADSDSGRAPFWIELGGQFAQNQSNQEAFLPPFLLTPPQPPFDAASPAALEKGPASSWDGTAKIGFEPAGTDWVFSVGIRYGTNARNDSRNEKTTHVSTGGLRLFYDAYQSITARNTRSHAIVDFQAGKDAGLGMFGSNGNSVFSLGLRYAQFNSQGTVGIQSQPTNVVAGYGRSYHLLNASLAAKRKFAGVGPSLSWDASAGLIGNPSAGNITFDWGLNGAVLFGRQRTRIHHQTSNFQVVSLTGDFYNGGHRFPHIPVYQHAASPDRSKTATVPNFGGFAGVSWRYPNAKVSIGYRADMFFGAMDGGIDAARKENVGFYGPFATISIGIGG